MPTSRLPALSPLSLHRALQLHHPSPSTCSARPLQQLPSTPRRSFSLWPSRSPPDPYRIRVRITPKPPPSSALAEEVDLKGKKKPGLKQWSIMLFLVTGNFVLLKYIMDRADDRELIALEKERQGLLGKGKEVRKRLGQARKQWLLHDVQEKKQGFMMREESAAVREQMQVYRTRAEELRDQWIERDLKEQGIVLCTPEERADLSREREEAQERLKEVRWEEQMRLRFAERRAESAESPSLDASSVESLSVPPFLSVGAIAASDPAEELASRISEIDRCLSLDARAAEIKSALLEEKATLVADAKENNEKAGVLRQEWAARDASEKGKRFALKHEKTLLADQAKDFVHELDEIDKKWKDLRTRIAAAKGIEMTGVEGEVVVGNVGVVDEKVVKKEVEVERSGVPGAGGKEGE